MTRYLGGGHVRVYVRMAHNRTGHKPDGPQTKSPGLAQKTFYLKVKVKRQSQLLRSQRSKSTSSILEVQPKYSEHKYFKGQLLLSSNHNLSTWKSEHISNLSEVLEHF